MSPFNEPLVVLTGFGLLLLLLAWAGEEIGQRIQGIVHLLTGSSDLAMVVLFLVFLPGILLHEGAHWAMAKLLGLRTGKFRVWPRRMGRHIGMGSVSVARGGPVRDSLVGLAPLLVGSLVVGWIGGQLDQAGSVTVQWQQGGGLLQGIAALIRALGTAPDGLLWGYLLFAVANAMMPSASDREPLGTLGLYLAGFGLVYLLLGRPGHLLAQAGTWLVGPLRDLLDAFVLTALLDLVVVAGLYLVETGLGFLYRSR